MSITATRLAGFQPIIEPMRETGIDHGGAEGPKHFYGNVRLYSEATRIECKMKA